MNVRASTHCCDDRRSSAFAFVGLYFNDDIAVDNMYVYLLLRIVFVYSISIRNTAIPQLRPSFSNFSTSTRLAFLTRHGAAGVAK